MANNKKRTQSKVKLGKKEKPGADKEVVIEDAARKANDPTVLEINGRATPNVTVDVEVYLEGTTTRFDSKAEVAQGGTWACSFSGAQASQGYDVYASHGSDVATDYIPPEPDETPLEIDVLTSPTFQVAEKTSTLTISGRGLAGKFISVDIYQVELLTLRSGRRNGMTRWRVIKHDDSPGPVQCGAQGAEDERRSHRLRGLGTWTVDATVTPLPRVEDEESSDQRESSDEKEYRYLVVARCSRCRDWHLVPGS